MPTLHANLLSQWTGGQWRFGVPSVVTGVSVDSRTLVPGDLFVAIRGPRFDGHCFVQQALKKGASGAVVGRESPSCSGPGPLLCVPDTVCALRDMAASYRRQMGLVVIAVTGSVGKTTVKEMVADILAMRMPTVRTRGNWNNEIGLPLSLLNMEPASRVGVFEVGTNHPGELAPLCRMLAPDWGLITMIAPVHLEFFKSVEAVAEEKSELLKSLPRHGIAILRRDDAWYERLRAVAPGRVITLAMEGEADYHGTAASEWNGMAHVVEKASGERFSFRMPLPGRHQLVNALFAIAVGRAHGLAWEAIRQPLERYRPQPMRWECQSVNGMTVVNDAYNANPVSMAAALHTFSEMPVQGRKWLVLAGMLELGPAETQAHRDLGATVAGRPWAGLIVVGRLGAMMADAAEEAGMDPTRVFRCKDHAQAAQRLCGETTTGDAVLFKGSRGQRIEQVLALWIQAIRRKE